MTFLLSACRTKLRESFYSHTLFQDDIEGGLGSTGDSNETASTISEGACEDEFNDFRCSFEDLLRQHSFIKVPGLKDYFFYWPHSTCATTQMPSFDELIEGKFEYISNMEHRIYSENG